MVHIEETKCETGFIRFRTG